MKPKLYKPKFSKTKGCWIVRVDNDKGVQEVEYDSKAKAEAAFRFIREQYGQATNKPIRKPDRTHAWWAELCAKVAYELDQDPENDSLMKKGRTIAQLATAARPLTDINIIEEKLERLEKITSTVTQAANAGTKVRYSPNPHDRGEVVD